MTDMLSILAILLAPLIALRVSKKLDERGHYFPRAYGDLEDEQTIIRKGLVDIFKKKAPFPVLAFIVPPPSTDKGKEGDMAKIQPV